jgi:hypothetical protein
VGRKEGVYLEEDVNFNVLVEDIYSAATGRLGIALEDVDLRSTREGEDDGRKASERVPEVVRVELEEERRL